MTAIGLKKIYCAIGLLLLFVQVANLVYCGDADCLKGGESEDCTTLLCVMLHKHAQSNARRDNDEQHDKHCTCHLQFSLPETVPFVIQRPVVAQASTEPVFPAGFFAALIFHPPKN